MEHGNLIENDPMVAAIFEEIQTHDGSSSEKLAAIIRAGKIAEIYISADCQITSVMEPSGNTSIAAASGRIPVP